MPINKGLRDGVYFSERDKWLVNGEESYAAKMVNYSGSFIARKGSCLR
jgi:hypothetical protein